MPQVCGCEGTHDVACLGGRVHSALRHAAVPSLHLLVRAVQARREKVARLVALRTFECMRRRKVVASGPALSKDGDWLPARNVVCKQRCGPTHRRHADDATAVVAAVTVAAAAALQISNVVD